MKESRLSSALTIKKGTEENTPKKKIVYLILREKKFVWGILIRDNGREERKENKASLVYGC